VFMCFSFGMIEWKLLNTCLLMWFMKY
jgi:hypothetical protein